MTRLNSILAGLGAAAVATGLSVGQAAAEWSPRKPVEFIIMAGTGGGADQLARLIQGMVEQKGLSPRPFIPINKGGGSGAEALRYLQDKAGDNHTIMVTLNSFYTTPLMQEDLGVDVTEFTPIGLMALDTFLLWVHNDSGIDSLEAYVDTVKSSDNYRMGGTGTGQEDSILTAMLEAEHGLEINYVPFGGGGTVAKNLVGKHVDSTVNNPSEAIEFWRNGDVRPIVQFTEARMPAFPDVPTAKELGHDIEYYMQRSINGPPGMDPEAQAWYANVFKTIFESEEWQTYCTDKALFCDEWIAGDDLAEFHQTQIVRHKSLIEKVGVEALAGE